MWIPLICWLVRTAQRGTARQAGHLPDTVVAIQHGTQHGCICICFRLASGLANRSSVPMRYLICIIQGICSAYEPSLTSFPAGTSVPASDVNESPTCRAVYHCQIESCVARYSLIKVQLLLQTAHVPLNGLRKSIIIRNHHSIICSIMGFEETHSRSEQFIKMYMK